MCVCVCVFEEIESLKGNVLWTSTIMNINQLRTLPTQSRDVTYTHIRGLERCKRVSSPICRPLLVRRRRGCQKRSRRSQAVLRRIRWSRRRGRNCSWSHENVQRMLHTRILVRVSIVRTERFDFLIHCRHSSSGRNLCDQLYNRSPFLSYLLDPLESRFRKSEHGHERTVLRNRNQERTR